jgi:hypothetical protein
MRTESPASRGFFFHARSTASALHRTEELGVGLGVLQQEFHRGDLVHGVQQLA